VKPRAGRALVVAVTAASALALAWGRLGKCNDVLVDFGRELYVPWRLAEGDVLYRDVAHYLGPLSQYVNALWFRLFGVGLRTLELANLALLGVALVLLYRLHREVAGRVASAAAGLLFLVAFAFAHPVRFGNYDWVAPYGHEAVHGTILALGATLAAIRHARSGSLRALAAAGFLLGLAALTRPEPFVAGAAACGAAVALRSRRPGDAGGARVAATLLGPALVPPLAAFLLLATALPAGEALAALLAPFASATNGALLALPFNRAGMGIDDPAGNLGRIALAAGGWAAVLGVPLLLALRARLLPPAAGAALAFLAAAAACLLLGLADGSAPVPVAFEAPRPLPLAVAAIGAWSAVAFLRARRRGGDDPRARAGAVLALFALAMLGKMLLNARVHNYGFVHAAPATLLVAVALLDGVPRLLDARGARGRVFAVGAAAALLLWTASVDLASREWYAGKTVPVGGGPDRFLAEEARGKPVAELLAEAGRRVPPGATLAALPEGAMVNYLLRRRNPTRYVNLMPTECALFGEEAVLAAYRAAPPDFLLLVDKDTSEFGPRTFGRDYGRGFPRWVGERYRVAVQVGAKPLEGKGFGLLLLERKR
jgi:hypothetical protein